MKNPGGSTDSGLSEPRSSPREIRVLTINVWSGLTYKGVLKSKPYPDQPRNRYEQLVTELRTLDPDIIAIQEANPVPDYARSLASDLSLQAVYRVENGGVRFGSAGLPINLREGMAILVKRPWSIEEIDGRRLGGGGIVTNWFCFHFGEATHVLLCRVVVNGKPLYVYNVHLHSGPFTGKALEAVIERLSQELPPEKVDEAKKGLRLDIEQRKQEMANLKAFIDETLPRDMPALILGDFNTATESGELDPLLSKGEWIDTFQLKHPLDEGITWDPPNNPNFRQGMMGTKPYELLHTLHDRYPHRIDFILANRNIPRERILESKVVLIPKDGRAPSDHYGVLTTLIW